MHARAGKAVLTALPTSDQQRVITTSVSSSPTIYEACCLEQQTPRTPLKPPSLPIGVTERKEPIDSPIKYFGIFFARAGPNDLSKHSGVHSVLDQEIRHNAMVEEVRVPAETAEGSTVPSQTTAGSNAAGELNQMVDEMIEELEHKLGAVSAEIMAKMDDMSRRLDNLEASIQVQNNQSANPS